MTFRSTSLVVILTLFACADKKHEATKRYNQIQKVSFATGGCYGKCPFLAIQIDSSLSYKFYGGRYAEKQGFYTAKVTQEFWDSLNIKLEQANFNQLDTLYNATVDDMSIESYFTYGQTRKRLYGQEMDLPDSVRKVFYWLMDSYKNIQLTKVDTLLLETKIQFGQGPIPPPKIIKFIPPKIVE
jgi:hypothetical protein